MNKLLFLDFDGVLFDTVAEAYYVCIHTKMFQNERLPENALEKFEELRPLVGPARNYYDIMEAIVSGASTTNILPFNKNSVSKRFEEDFFETRKKIKSQDYGQWIKLNKPYPFFQKLQKILSEKKRLKTFIISTKDQKSIEDILSFHSESSEYINGIFDKEEFNKYDSKKDIIESILSLEAKPYQALFIDDVDCHILACETIPFLKIIQAKWGYVSQMTITSYACSVDEALEQIQNL